MGCKLKFGAGGELIFAECTRNSFQKFLCHACSSPASMKCCFPLGGKKTGHICGKHLCKQHTHAYEVKDLPEDIQKRAEESGVIYLCGAHLRYVEKLKVTSGR